MVDVVHHVLSLIGVEVLRSEPVVDDVHEVFVDF